MDFLGENKLRLVKAAETAATGNVDSAEVSLADGAESVTFFCTIATANAGNYIKVQGSTATGFGTPVDLDGTAVVAAANGDVVAVTVVRPVYPFLRARVVRGASTAVGDIYAISAGGRKAPIDNNVDSEIVSESHVSPASGTA